MADLDFWGFTSSLLCAIHCALMPLLLSVGLLNSSWAWLNHPLVEITVALFSIYFVYQSLLKGYAKGEVHRSTFFMATIGLVLIITHHFLGQLATIAVVCGGLMVALSHFQNMYLHWQLHHRKSLISK